MLGYVDASTGKRIEIQSLDDVKSTYVQTMGRNKFAAVGLGRPPFNISMGSPYRSTGFMSEAVLFRQGSQTSVFKSCKTIEQCFVDMFTFNGKAVKRRVFNPASRAMQDWTGLDGQNCGIFGIWLKDRTDFDKMCPGEDFATRHCCYMDPAVAPLFYIFHYHWDEPLAKKVTDTCDTYEVKNHLSNMGAVYTTSRTSLQERDQRLASIKTRLNQILDEFAPGSRSSPRGMPTTAFEYLKTMDCSVALYDALQQYTACPSSSSSIIMDSSPFCTSYSFEQQYRTGIYYFLDYTMEEVPFAWWHKCMLLQGRTFASALLLSPSGFIQCDEWKTTTISEDFINKTSLFSDSSISVRDVLSRIEGGITTAMVDEAIKQYKIALQAIVRDYIQSGFPDSSSSEQQDNVPNNNPLIHRGAAGISPCALFHLSLFGMSFH